jgi:D-alanyl-D-alanine carboxypeptidase (penicillin-binding protein 5/6)
MPSPDVIAAPRPATASDCRHPAAARAMAVVGWVSSVLFLLSVAAGGVFLGVVQTRPLPQLPVAAANTPVPEAMPPLDWQRPSSAAIGTLSDGLKTLVGPQDARSTASIAKVITVLVVASVHPLTPSETGPDYTMTGDDVREVTSVASDFGSFLPVRVGQVWTQRQILDGILLASANNLANRYAIWAFGSMPAYRSAAMDWLAAHGLIDTTVGSDACGLDPATTSTPSDLFELGRLLMDDPGLAQIVGQVDVDGPDGLTITNSDALIGTDGFVGIKTGTLTAAGYCLLFANHQVVDGVDVVVIGVELGESSSMSRLQAARDLVDYALANIVPNGVSAGQAYGYVTDLDGDLVPVVAASSIDGLRWRDEPITVTLSESSIDMPANAGTVLGSVDVAGQSVPLVLGSSVEAGDLGWRLSHLRELVW